MTQGSMVAGIHADFKACQMALFNSWFQAVLPSAFLHIINQQFIQSIKNHLYSTVPNMHITSEYQ